uniref:Pseudouridine synthase RsuA/RluA-like domain-containing protein n=1 Tax=Parascaris univalens TaxID=6257 RepID=A0A914ZK57_PARUN
SNLNELLSMLTSETILHEPGRFVIVNKPFGVSCVGYKQKNGGVFPESRFDRKNASEEDTNDDIQRCSGKM